MLGRLPERIEPRVLAEAGRQFVGEIPLSAMQRVASQVMTAEGTAKVEVNFGIDAAGIRFLTGRVQCELQLTCQRCLGPMDFVVDTAFSLGLVVDEGHGQQLPSHYEPLILASEPMLMAEIVEDEVLLVLPVAAMHEAPHPCAAVTTREKQPEAKRENPFAVLAQLKRDS